MSKIMNNKKNQIVYKCINKRENRTHKYLELKIKIIVTGKNKMIY